MEQRYATNPDQIPGMTTADLRERYLVPEVFVPGEIRLVYTHHDRIVLGGAVPAGGTLELTGYPEIRSDFFLEHRELGIINVGGTGTVTADGEEYTLVKGACLYLGRGIQTVSFADADGELPEQMRGRVPVELESLRGIDASTTLHTLRDFVHHKQRRV